MQVTTESMITGSAEPTFARRERLTEWGFPECAARNPWDFHVPSSR